MVRLPDYPFPEELKKVLKMLDNKEDNGMVLHNVWSEKAKMYIKILNIWEKAKCIEPSTSQYFQLLKFALYLEEYQGEIDMRKYDLKNKLIIKTDDDTLLIKTDEWNDEERPLIRINDLINVLDIREKKWYSLSIVNITETSIKASGEKFLERYSKTKPYDIRFRYQNYPVRCQQFALWLAYQNNVIKYLFPNNLRQSSNDTTTTIFNSINSFFNPTIQNNKEQVQAVSNILYKSSFPLPYILYGPPGTGKTATIVEAICQIILQNSENRVLVCTPSNTASDEVTKRLVNCLSDIAPVIIYRMYSGSKEPSTIDKEILPCSNCKNGKISTFINIEDFTKKRIVITTLCNCTKLLLMRRLKSNYFSHVIIDEAGQSIEPEILIPVSLVSENGQIYSQIVLAGDPKQLGPVAISKRAGIVLGRSILERLMSYEIYQKNSSRVYNCKFITKLLMNYRSHPKIIGISNKLFYNSELIPRSITESDKFPVIFYGTHGGKEEKRRNSTSSCNRREIDMVLRKIKELLNTDDICQEDIGVVTPFKLQSKELKKGLARRNLRDINVGTVELFQGQEKKIIIISAVRTRIFPNGEFEHIGSLSNPKRFNVAVTRAKEMLIIIGDPNALQIDASWRYLLEYCIDNNSSYDVRSKLKPLQPNNNSSFNSEITLSNNIFTWRKFKIFKLDESDSNAELSETINEILYPPPAPVIQRQPTRPPLFIPIYANQCNPAIIPKEKTKSWCTIL